MAKTIMIVDDEKDLRDIIEFKFKSKGFVTVTACDGVDALDKLKTIEPDLIVLDMNMPRMDGLEFYNAIRGNEVRSKCPVLILTARANMGQTIKDSAIEGFMPKPFELNDLINEAEAIIRKSSVV